MRYSGFLTDIPGIRVGHAQNEAARTGCTAILCPPDTVGGVAVRGAAPGTRETDLLDPQNTVSCVHGIMLCGGSAFGLAAADGAMRYLEQQGIGIDVGAYRVPIVPAAVIFDLGVGDGSVRPTREMGYEACAAAREIPTAQGNIGAGCGATVGKMLGDACAMPGGLGSATVQLGGGVLVSALTVVNAVGDVYDIATGQKVAGVRLADGTMPHTMDMMLQQAPQAPAGGNTTIGVVATNAALTKAQANRLAQVAHDGLAWAVRPAHLPMDGDTLFALGCGQQQADFAVLCAAAMRAVAQSIVNAVCPQAI